MEEAVGGVGSACQNAVCDKARHGRGDNLDLFASQGPPFAGMRIEASHGDSRTRDAEIALQGSGGDRPTFTMAAVVNSPGTAEIGSWIVTRATRSALLAIIITGPRPSTVSAGARCARELGMSGEAKTGRVKRGLGDRPGHQSAGVAKDGQLCAQPDPLDDRRRCLGRRTSRDGRFRQRDVQNGQVARECGARLSGFGYLSGDRTPCARGAVKSGGVADDEEGWS